MKLTKTILIAGMTVYLTGCAGWRSIREPEPLELPDQYLQADSIGVYLDDPWWTAIGDAGLNAVMEEAFAENLTLQLAFTRLEQSRQLLKTANSTWFPMVNASGTYVETDSLTEQNTAGQPAFTMYQPAYSAGLTAAYEIDLWGRLKSSRQASAADYRATKLDLNAMALSLSANVAGTYYAIIELKLQLDLMDKTIDFYTANKGMIEGRYRRGLVSSLDLYQAESSLMGALAQKTVIETNLALTENVLAVTLGKYPEADDRIDDLNIPVEFTVPQPGLPSELLKRRPDVMAAYQRLVAADRRAAEAVANRFPSFSLTGSISGGGDDLSAALDTDNMIWKAIGNVTIPIFEGGRRKAGADLAQARWEGELINYKSALLNAFMEVENALITGKNQQENVTYLEAQVKASEAAMRLADNQYLRGIISYLQVVVAQNNYLNAKRSLITARRHLVQSRIQLVTALGGGWTSKYVEKQSSSKLQADSSWQ